jgi:hypothetical protein
MMIAATNDDVAPPHHFDISMPEEDDLLPVEEESVEEEEIPPPLSFEEASNGLASVWRTRNEGLRKEFLQHMEPTLLHVIMDAEEFHEFAVMNLVALSLDVSLVSGLDLLEDRVFLGPATTANRLEEHDLESAVSLFSHIYSRLYADPKKKKRRVPLSRAYPLLVAVVAQAIANCSNDNSSWNQVMETTKLWLKDSFHMTGDVVDAGLALFGLLRLKKRLYLEGLTSATLLQTLAAGGARYVRSFLRYGPVSIDLCAAFHQFCSLACTCSSILTQLNTNFGTNLWFTKVYFVHACGGRSFGMRQKCYRRSVRRNCTTVGRFSPNE